MSFTVIIPARYASRRFPGKMLADIQGRPMIQHVHEAACASDPNRVIIATDDTRIESVAQGFGAQVVMTAEHHPSASCRLAQVVAQLNIHDDECIVNLQGDEPLMSPDNIRQVALNLQVHGEHVAAATLAEPIHHATQLLDPHIVKVTRNVHGHALYFSRAPIPHLREAPSGELALPQPPVHYRHVGIYAYSAGFLSRYAQWPSCSLERLEDLEQLRILWHGEAIHVDEAVAPTGIGVDMPADIERVCALLDQTSSL